MKNRITTVLFDIDNTLIDFNKSAIKAIGETFEFFNIPYDQSIFALFFKENKKLWEKVEKSLIMTDELHKIRWKIIFEKSGHDFDGVEFEKKFNELLAFSAIEVDGARDLIEYLSPKYTLCVASNTSLAERQNRRLDSLGFTKYFKHRFYSCEMGAPKPSVKFFEKCFEALSDTSKNEVVFIGDSISADIKGAKNFGISSIWFNFNKETEAPETVPDITVLSLDEIKNIL